MILVINIDEGAHVAWAPFLCAKIANASGYSNSMYLLFTEKPIKVP